MDKIEAKYLIGLQYTKKKEGVSSFHLGDISYQFTDIEKNFNGLQLAKQVSILTNNPLVKFKDLNDVYTLSVNMFDELLAKIILDGNSLWEKKISKYEALESASTDKEIEDIVNSNW